MSAEQAFQAAYSEQTYEYVQNSRKTMRSCAKDVVPLHENILTALGVVICGAALWMITGLGAQIDQLNYQVDALQQQVHVTLTQNATLASQVDTMTQPNRILAIATGKLHMLFGTPVQVPGASTQQSSE